MGCTQLYTKKLQKIEEHNIIDENYNQNDKVLIININDLANSKARFRNTNGFNGSSHLLFFIWRKLYKNA